MVTRHCLLWNEDKQNRFYRATHSWLESADLSDKIKAELNNCDILEGDGQAAFLPQTKKEGTKQNS